MKRFITPINIIGVISILWSIYYLISEVIWMGIDTRGWGILIVIVFNVIGLILFAIDSYLRKKFSDNSKLLYRELIIILFGYILYLILIVW